MDTDLLLCEELFLVAYDDEKGKDTTWYGIDPGLAGALLLDLADGEHLAERDGKLVRTGSEPAHPLLREAAQVIGSDDKPRNAKHWVGKLPGKVKPLQKRLGEGLAERGVLRDESRKMLGLIPVKRFAEADPAPERAIRDRLERALLGGEEPDARTATLISLLSATDLVKKVVPRDRRKDAKKRAKEVAESGIVGDAVSKTMRDIEAGVMIAVMASAAASSGGGGDGGGGGS